ncbi:MAG: cupredoxin domain-containing protein [Candidatus Paceibacterota bacterium]|jgi:plastocyanin domain-containing protein
MKNFIIAASIIAVGLIVGEVFLSARNNSVAPQGINANNVSIVDGKQIIEISAKGGYQPRTSIAKAGIPTILRFQTTGTFDCSSSVRIPSLNISKVLPQTGTTDIDLGSQPLTTLQGTCGMGMYPFEVVFSAPTTN